MPTDELRVLDILVRENYITPEDAARAKAHTETTHGSALSFLVSENLMTKDLLGQAIAESYGVPYADLNSNVPPTKQVLRVPEDVAKQFRVVLFAENDKVVAIATDDPSKEGLRDAVQSVFPSKKLGIVYSLTADIDSVFEAYRKPLDTRFSKIIAAQKRVAPELIEQILSDAVSYRASDIHFEPLPDEVVIRFRVDGTLRESGRMPREYYENLLNRIKVQSRLRIDEHHAAQDGSMHHEKDGVVVDIRTSIVPTINGEKVVMRILAAYVEGLGLANLGFSPKFQAALEEAASKPFGMLLVTGPTGSGKTTTLYALLKMLQRPEVNITTIEDPVEYKIAGINQIQVNMKTGMSFANGLRSIVRQDPDVILVGEIRDRETAEIAVNAALTGHLLLSTFHANDAATAIPRLLDMGIEPFLLASTLEIIIAQRLVRKICEHCRYSEYVSPMDTGLPRLIAEHFFGKKKVLLYRGKGCESCGDKGFKGRTAIYEFIRNTPKMQDLILKRPSTQEIWNLAISEGATTLFEDGIEKVRSGVTTVSELKRVAEISVGAIPH
jgi:type II secretory ATPase GspE/PulE/Tfp pilus assembly ATPase PilB-like protein